MRLMFNGSIFRASPLNSSARHGKSPEPFYGAHFYDPCSQEEEEEAQEETHPSASNRPYLEDKQDGRQMTQDPTHLPRYFYQVENKCAAILILFFFFSAPTFQSRINP